MIDSISVTPLLEAAPAVSTSSAPAALDFSALLTELVGTLEETIAEEAATPLVPASVQLTEALLQPYSPPREEGWLRQEAKAGEAVLIAAAGVVAQAALLQVVTHPSAPLEVAPQHLLDVAATSPDEEGITTKTPVLPAVVAAIAGEAAVEDVTKFEISIQHEALKPAEVEPQAELAKQPVITTDPLASTRQPQLPLRVIAIQKVSSEANSPQDHKNPAAAPDADDATATASMPAFQLSEPGRMFEAIEQARPAQFVEIPDLPKLQVIRTVSMEVGDAESRVIVRIEDRGGTMNLHFGAGNENMRRSLESSLGSLKRALKREQIEVSNVEVTGRSPKERVNRMKEAR